MSNAAAVLNQGWGCQQDIRVNIQSFQCLVVILNFTLLNSWNYSFQVLQKQMKFIVHGLVLCFWVYDVLSEQQDEIKYLLMSRNTKKLSEWKENNDQFFEFCKMWGQDVHESHAIMCSAKKRFIRMGLLKPRLIKIPHLSSSIYQIIVIKWPIRDNLCTMHPQSS